MPGRTIAIGDIHGCERALNSLLIEIGLREDDKLVFLGDFIDRGADSRGVIETLLDLRKRHSIVAIMGNHEEMLLESRRSDVQFRGWMEYGGKDTLASYGVSRVDEIPESHIRCFGDLVPYHETETHLFLHANYLENLPLSEQPVYCLRWQSLHERVPKPHVSGKVAVVGHTALKSGEIIDIGYLKAIDTACVNGGWLTALEVESGRIWQVDREGRLRG